MDTGHTANRNYNAVLHVAKNIQWRELDHGVRRSPGKTQDVVRAFEKISWPHCQSRKTVLHSGQTWMQASSHMGVSENREP